MFRITRISSSYFPIKIGTITKNISTLIRPQILLRKNLYPMPTITCIGLSSMHSSVYAVFKRTLIQNTPFEEECLAAVKQVYLKGDTHSLEILKKQFLFSSDEKEWQLLVSNSLGKLIKSMDFDESDAFQAIFNKEDYGLTAEEPLTKLAIDWINKGLPWFPQKINRMFGIKRAEFLEEIVMCGLTKNPTILQPEAIKEFGIHDPLILQKMARHILTLKETRDDQLNAISALGITDQKFLADLALQIYIKKPVGLDYIVNILGITDKKALKNLIKKAIPTAINEIHLFYYIFRFFNDDEITRKLLVLHIINYASKEKINGRNLLHTLFIMDVKKHLSEKSMGEIFTHLVMKTNLLDDFNPKSFADDVYKVIRNKKILSNLGEVLIENNPDFGFDYFSEIWGGEIDCTISKKTLSKLIQISPERFFELLIKSPVSQERKMLEVCAEQSYDTNTSLDKITSKNLILHTIDYVSKYVENSKSLANFCHLILKLSTADCPESLDEITTCLVTKKNIICACEPNLLAKRIRNLGISDENFLSNVWVFLIDTLSHNQIQNLETHYVFGKDDASVQKTLSTLAKKSPKGFLKLLINLDAFAIEQLQLLEICAEHFFHINATLEKTSRKNLILYAIDYVAEHVDESHPLEKFFYSILKLSTTACPESLDEITTCLVTKKNIFGASAADCIAEYANNLNNVDEKILSNIAEVLIENYPDCAYRYLYNIWAHDINYTISKETLSRLAKKTPANLFESMLTLSYSQINLKTMLEVYSEQFCQDELLKQTFVKLSKYRNIAYVKYLIYILVNQNKHPDPIFKESMLFFAQRKKNKTDCNQEKLPLLREKILPSIVPARWLSLMDPERFQPDATVLAEFLENKEIRQQLDKPSHFSLLKIYLTVCHAIDNSTTLSIREKFSILKLAAKMAANSPLDAEKIFSFFYASLLLHKDQELLSDEFISELTSTQDFDKFSSNFLIESLDIPELKKDDIAKKIPDILKKCRFSGSVLIYGNRLASLKNPQINQNFSIFLKGLSENTILEERYKIEKHPTLNLFSSYNPMLLTKWKDNISLPKDSFQDLSVEETDDPLDLLEVPSLVSTTCQHVLGDPGLNQCLLSYVMNGDIKLLVVKEKEKFIGRALIRIIFEENNRPAILMETPYGKAKSFPLLLALAKKKASELQIPLFSKSFAEGALYQNPLTYAGGRYPTYSDLLGGKIGTEPITCSVLNIKKFEVL